MKSEVSLAVTGVIFNTLEGGNVHLQCSEQEARALVVWNNTSKHLHIFVKYLNLLALNCLELALLHAPCLCSRAE